MSEVSAGVSILTKEEIDTLRGCVLDNSVGALLCTSHEILRADKERLERELAEARISTAMECWRIVCSFHDWDKRDHGVLVKSTPQSAFIAGQIVAAFGLHSHVLADRTQATTEAK